MDEVRIRRAGPADAGAICDVHVGSIRGLNAPFYRSDQIEAWARGKRAEIYVESMERHGVLFWVAEEGDTMVGFASMAGDEITGLYIAPARARRGLGSRLLEAMEAEARRQGQLKLHLQSSMQALVFYRARGFRDLKTELYPLRGGGELEAVMMEKELSQP